MQPVAVITGGATGIGFATAKALISNGWSVWVCGRRESALSAAKAALPALNTAVCDVSNPISVQSLFATIAESAESIQALINNAALLNHGDYKTQSHEEMMALFSVNCVGPVLCIQSALPMMRMGGKIINISSVAAVDPFPGLEVYGMSKAALGPLSAVLNKEPGITATDVQLGAVDTDMLQSFLPDYEATTKPADIAKKLTDYICDDKEILL